jgi:hypothetical protein
MLTIAKGNFEAPQGMTSHRAYDITPQQSNSWKKLEPLDCAMNTYTHLSVCATMYPSQDSLCEENFWDQKFPFLYMSTQGYHNHGPWSTK